jgi:hypothetical protein
VHSNVEEKHAVSASILEDVGSMFLRNVNIVTYMGFP